MEYFAHLLNDAVSCSACHLPASLGYVPSLARLSRETLSSRWRGVRSSALGFDQTHDPQLRKLPHPLRTKDEQCFGRRIASSDLSKARQWELSRLLVVHPNNFRGFFFTLYHLVNLSLEPAGPLLSFDAHSLLELQCGSPKGQCSRLVLELVHGTPLLANHEGARSLRNGNPRADGTEYVRHSIDSTVLRNLHHLEQRNRSRTLLASTDHKRQIANILQRTRTSLSNLRANGTSLADNFSFHFAVVQQWFHGPSHFGAFIRLPWLP
mmetsp:Transcript_44233/g.117218  ORF Transcript_44233/g.117218 Transcript_44233/m.117218 type:complete len:266 (+) Transcript_44233:452-1249(+)